MTEKYSAFEQRKQDHIDIVLTKNTQTAHLSGFDSIILPHEAMPDLNFDEIDISTHRFNQKSNTPFIVSSMTAGHKNASNINRTLIAACDHSGWSMGVGSQRRELSDKQAFEEWTSLIHDFPNVSLFSNLGIAQVCQTPVAAVQRLLDNINARGLIIHLNPLQECLQPEGTPNFRGCWKALATLRDAIELPIIIKETGCGFSTSTLKRLNELGVDAVDVSGLGGTHWGRVEGYRAKQSSIKNQAAQTFNDWGVSTVQSLIYAREIQPNFEIWGSGGVRSGLDAAKLISLGASTIGLAKPLLEAALQGMDTVINLMQAIEYELKTALFCTGSANLKQLQESYHATKC